MVITGIETAGLVLAVLPLIISALESYEKGYRRLKAVWFWEKELEKLLRCLKEQQVHFRANMERLLRAALPGEDTAELLQYYNRELWCGSMKVDVEAYFIIEGAFASFRDAVKQYEGCIKRIAGKLENILPYESVSPISWI